jgi:hypothetical protein
MIEAALGSEEPRAASRAVSSLSKVFSGFLPSFGRASTVEEVRWQDAERLTALQIIERRIERAPFPVALARELSSPW